MLISNAFIREFTATIESRYSADRSTMSMSEWISENTHLKKKPFSFKGYEFQRAIADDMHPNLCVIKISQIGMSEIQLRKMLGFLRRNTGVTAIFTMPNDKMRDRISQTRVKPLIDTEPVFNPPTVEKPVRQKGLYQIDHSFAYFTGSTEGDATSIPADMLMHDEIDLTDQQIIGLFQSRMLGSNYKIKQAFSTPSHVGFGIDSLYQISDQHEYLYRCPCGHHQIPTFTAAFVDLPGLPADLLVDDLSKLSINALSKIEMEKTRWRCERCDRSLDLTDPTLREWVPKYPLRPSRGYRVRPTSVPTLSVPYIFSQMREYLRVDNLRGFRNTVLGEPDHDGAARLNEAEIKAIMRSPAPPDPFPSRDVPCFIGIDVGLTCHIVLATQSAVFLWLQVPAPELKATVEGLVARFRIVSGCMDRYPYTPLSEEIRDLKNLPGVIVPVAYATSPNVPPLHEEKDEFEVMSHYVAHRTKAIDKVVSSIRQHQISFVGYGHLDQVIISHLQSMIRIELPEKPPVWTKLDKEDHFFHALAYVILSQRLLAVKNFDPDEDKRSNVFLISGKAPKVIDLSPNGLNLAAKTGGSHILVN